MARYCRNKEEKKRSTQMPLNKFEILKNRVMQRGEGSGREIEKDRKKILKEERANKEKRKTKIEKKKEREKKEKTREVEEKIKEEKEVEM